MIVKNEANRYLRDVLSEVRTYIDAAVIIDDHSTDNTVAICQEMLQGIPLKILTNNSDLFEKHESELREKQWNETIGFNADWILNLDADEIPEKKLGSLIATMINNENVDAYSFRFFDFWDKDHYREDCYWRAHLKSTFIFLARFIPTIKYTWSKKPLHSGRWPLEINNFITQHTNLRFKHFGWATPEDRKNKYKFYMRLDPNGKFGWSAQYASILDKKPKLKLWRE